MDSTIFLGTVQEVRNRGGHPFAFVSPTHSWSEMDRQWKTIADVLQEFPTRGNLIWLDLPAETPSAGSLWFFRREENPRQGATNRYRVHDPEEVFEIIDLRQHGDEGARAILTEVGLFLQSPPTSRVYIWFERRFALGPVSLVHADRPNFWRLDPNTYHEPIDVVEIEPDPIAVGIDPKRSRLVMPPYCRPQPTGEQVDWAPDTVVLERAIKLLKRIGPELWEKLSLSERIIEEMVADFRLDEESDGLVGLRLRRLKRARAILDSLRLTKNEAERLTRELCEVPVIAHRLEAVQETARSEALMAAEKEAAKLRQAALREAEHIRQEAETEAAAIRAASDQARAELDRLTAEIEHKRAELMAQADALDTELESRLSNLLSRPERLLADVAILRVASRLWNGAMIDQKSHASALTNGHDASSLHRQRPPFPWDDDLVEPVLLNDEEEFWQTLRSVIRRQGGSRDDAVLLHASFLSGAMPILAGPNAYETLDVYATVATGGRLLWLPISPSTLEPGDLFGRSDSVSGRFIPHAGGLLDLLLHASSTEDLFLVVLDGINRAPVEAYLLPLLSCYADSWRGGGGRTLPIAHPYTLDPKSPYAAAAWLRWPRNVLLAATLVKGTAVLPMPVDLWCFATRIDVAYTGGLLDGAGYLSKSEIRHVPLETWELWRQLDMDEENEELLDELCHFLSEEKFELPAGIVRLMYRTFATLLRWNDPNDALIDAVRLCVAPLAHETGKMEKLLKACEELGLDTELLTESSAQMKRSA